MLLWHYKNKENPKPWTTIIHVVVSGLLAGVMVVILLAVVKFKDAVSLLDTIDKNLEEKSVKVVTAKKNGTSYYKIDDSLYWQEKSKFLQKLQNIKVNIILTSTLC